MRKIACIVAVAAVAGLAAACGSQQATPPTGTRAETPSNGVVPWVDRPAAPYAEPAPGPFPTNARPCRPSDLRVSPGRSGAGLGNTNLRIRFTNRSATACVLTGYPAVAGVSATGTITPLHASHGSYFGDPGPPANIAPGQTAAVNVSGADACEPAQHGQHKYYPTLRIGLPAGGTAAAPRARFDAICGVSVSRFGVPAHQPVPLPPSPLIAHITAARTVHPGEDFTYTVTLANPTATAYSLKPCPAYQEYVVTQSSGSKAAVRDGYVVKDYYLNCDTVHEISTHGSVTYQMRLHLPPGLPTGVPAKFVWHLQGDAGPGTAAPLRTIA